MYYRCFTVKLQWRWRRHFDNLKWWWLMTGQTKVVLARMAVQLRRRCSTIAGGHIKLRVHCNICWWYCWWYLTIERYGKAHDSVSCVAAWLLHLHLLHLACYSIFQVISILKSWGLSVCWVLMGHGMLRHQADFAKQMMNMGFLTKAPQTVPPMTPEAPLVGNCLVGVQRCSAWHLEWGMHRKPSKVF